MALERLSLAVDAEGGADGATNGGEGDRKRQVEGGDDGSRAPRLPRWTRQEILVLIQGKRVAENRVRRGRAAGLAFGSTQVETKWASVSSYCKRHGVNREPAQCRKRWSNLSGDYKKIKEWESQIREETESFWVMRNDLRRERKLPGFFDREVYDILDSGTVGQTRLELGPPPSAAEEEAAPEETEAVFDSGRSAAAEDGTFSDFEQPLAAEEAEKDFRSSQEVHTTTVPAIPISEKQYRPCPEGCPSQGPTQQTSNPEMGATSQEGRKRRRFAADGDEEMTTLQSRLIEALERNGRLVSEHLEAQNNNFELERDQRKDHMGSLVAVLNRMADALGRIADKL
ncbi:hypothetical protein NMG60_11030999 [Bertholletia excelsa]